MVILGIAATSLAGLLLSSKPLWQDDFASLSPLPQSLLEQDRQLRQQFNASEPNHLLLIKGEDPEQLLQRSEAVRHQLQQDRSAESPINITLPSDFLPSQQQQSIRQHKLPNRDQLSTNLQQAMQGLLTLREQQLSAASAQLNAVSPLATLARGYSITRDESGKVLRRASDVKSGQAITTRLAEGEIRSIVE